MISVVSLMACRTKLTVIFPRLPLEQQRKYTSVFNALFRITKEEGLLTLWRVRAAQLKYLNKEFKLMKVSNKYVRVQENTANNTCEVRHLLQADT